MLLKTTAMLGSLLLSAAVQAQVITPLQAQVQSQVRAQSDQTAALFAQGRGDEAMRALETQVGTNPFDPVAMNNLAALKATHQDWNAAATLLVRAHRLAPENAVIGSNLDRLNAWLVSSMQTDGKPTPAETDRLNELAQIPPEPPELWVAPKTSAAGAQTK